MTKDEMLELANEIETHNGSLLLSLDGRFFRAVGKEVVGHLPRAVTNLQDAVDAVPEGWRISQISRHPRYDIKRWRVSLSKWGELKAVDAKAPNPAAALCSAILRAKAAEMESE